MQVIDLHSDALWRLTTLEDANFRNDPRLQTNLERLQQGKVKVQVFAIFVHENVPQNLKFLEVARQIEAFHTKVLSEPEMVHITEFAQIEKLEENQIGAILSLEGSGAIGEDLVKLDAILSAGVLLVGLTWNEENSLAHGAEQDPSLGLKPFGEQVIEILNAHNIIIDVSHLNEQSFWDVLPRAKHLIASHSNARALCDSPRNLTDTQAKALVDKGGHIHVVYYPEFIIEENRPVILEDLVAHLRYLADLVGVNALGLGSDFDGIDKTVEGLSNAGQTQNLLEAMGKQFTEEEIEAIAYKNFITYVQTI